ncbi:twin-arginine translocase TatA/TatE family subunit [Candidatus Woesearchaeota archaeon]|nr:twin-arginine translocase TatA/TatE family subunit [Candidatus Woesearchaeota archaeon]
MVFGLGMTEILLIVVVLIIVIGPKNIPQALRSIIKGWYHIKQQLSSMQQQTEKTKQQLVNDLKQDIGMEEIKKEIAQEAAEASLEMQKTEKKTKTNKPKPAKKQKN